MIAPPAVSGWRWLATVGCTGHAERCGLRGLEAALLGARLASTHEALAWWDATGDSRPLRRARVAR